MPPTKSAPTTPAAPERQLDGGSPRAQLLSTGQLQRLAVALAGMHEIGRTTERDRLLSRLEDNARALADAYALLTDAVRIGRRLTPAGEWFVDNYPLVEEEIRLARRHLPKSYSRQLPRVAGGEPGMPRVYAIALELISHAHGRVDLEALGVFVTAYQSVQPLLLGELWAIPIMLRLALIENLREVVEAVARGRRDRERAKLRADGLLAVAATHPSSVVLVLAEMIKEDPSLTPAFVSELATRIQGRGPAMLFPMAWLEQRLVEKGETLEGIFQLVSQRQAADQVTVGNSIGSLRFLDATDWRDFVEGASVVERALREDAVYPRMDFATRDRYRHAVEAVAKGSPLSELAIARNAIGLAAGGHVGDALVGEGRFALEAASQVRRPRRPWTPGARMAAYAGAIAALTAVLTAGMVVPTHAWLVLPLAALVASQLATAMVQWAVALLVPPGLLPRLDFSAGIPAAHRTLVAVPVMLTSPAGIDALVADLEVRFLANRDENLVFALVTDFRDAPAEHAPDDAALLSYAVAAMAGLAQRHAGDPGGGFHLLHRARRWNPREGVWMGWERKRGKLEDLNATLRGETGRFDQHLGDPAGLRGVRYVIVLDSDTLLPRDAGRELAATLGHPLNRPVFDPVRGRVTRGYGILQPRVNHTLESSQASRYARMSAGECGIDPYSRAVSDTYQDLFGEGSFIGKGIYDVDAVQQAIGGRLPENRVLSHDLLEGAYARSGLVSDIALFEHHPSSYTVDASRRARWIRGDWQVAGWLVGKVPGAAGRARNPISALSRWKILDNLRRSLVAPALVALLLVAWAVPGLAARATLLVVATIGVPGVLRAFATAVRRPAEEPLGQHARSVAAMIRVQVAQDVLTLAFLPADAVLALGALGRALVRMGITRRGLLEWRTAADAEAADRSGPLGFYRTLWAAPTLAVLAAWGAPAAAVPVLALWLVAPAIAWWASQPAAPASATLSADDARFLRGAARRTWRYFEDRVGAEDNDLPPDNVQEDPPVGAAHRTSPTNIGLALLANLAAYDFGYLTVDGVIARTTRTLAAMDRLERHRGHFYNWYDTRTLEPLRPIYISTVDSGNLAGHLVTLAAGLEELATRALLRPEILAGMADTAALAGVDLGALLSPVPATKPEWRARLTAIAAATADHAGGPWAVALAREAAAALAQLDAGGGPERVAALRDLAVRCRAFADIDFGLVYDPQRKLMSIGYNVTDHRLDAGFYDLLASEARLASFLGIAQGKLPQEHWFRLGRLLTTTRGLPALLSWSGSMFEYLMPQLVMPDYPGTLLAATGRAVVDRQRAYGAENGVPWGVSESGYNKTDAHLNYQYRAFGVPGLGFKRGLAGDLVIAPYASALALMVDPVAATANLRRLAAEERLGDYGFFEAVDYTPSRLPPGKTSVTVRSFMVHHQGMALLSFAYALLGRPMQRRFEADPALRGTLLLLQERIPRNPPIHPHPAERELRPGAMEGESDIRVIGGVETPFPEIQLLSNGRYHVAVTHSGGGYSRWNNLAVTRWIEDPSRDGFGTFLYVRDPARGQFWSAGLQPTQAPPSRYEAIFSPGRAELRRRDDGIETHVAISVSPEDDIELRQITLSNLGEDRRTLDVTTFAEVVLAPPGADASHRAFSNLFVQTELVRSQRAILCTRRPRSPGEVPVWMIHLVAVHGPTTGTPSFETDRAAFVGRGRSPADPAAMHQSRLGDGEGSVLDPVVAIRDTVVLEGHGQMRIHVVTGIAESREAALALVEKYTDRHVAGRVLELAWTHSQVVARRLDVSPADILLFDRLAGSVVLSTPGLRAPRAVIARNRLGQSGLWAYGISGDLPIVLVRITDAENIGLVRQMAQAHAWWRVRGLAVDLVIWNEDPSGYRQDLQDQILAAVTAVSDAALLDKPGGIFVRRGDQLSEDDSVLTQTIARVIVSDLAGSLADQLDRRPLADVGPPGFAPRHRAPPDPPAPPSSIAGLALWNGLGGFTEDGREYVIHTGPGQRTPLPWVNVLANPYFGTVVSESGSAYSWCENAHAYRLTPWSNDPVTDPSGEALYVRDEEDGRFWSPTPLPCGADACVTRHGFGYTVFESTHAGIGMELRTFVATDAPVKFLLLTLRNRSGRPRRLSLTACFDLVLGSQRAANLPHVVTAVDPKSGAFFATNPYAAEFAPRVAFLDCTESRRTVSGDRLEILGRNGVAASPAFLRRTRLSGRAGAGYDPCLAMQVSVDLADGEEREVAFQFGSGRDRDDARHIVRRFRGVEGARTALGGVWQYWNGAVGAVTVTTPDPTVDFLANGWLMYQVLASRMFGRSGFYQSGGAFGFRDQLQDAAAVLHSQPALLREQLLRAAARQFPQGDVQHWWHPPAGRGVRTRISDDYLWLPYVASRYVIATGDTGVLDELVDFVEGRAVKPDEDSYYDLPSTAGQPATLYDHCVRAIDHGLRFGARGLPLMGTGDWNDGMNLVGDEGRGESVWLAFFLHDVLIRFAAVARARGDAAYADTCVENARILAENIARHGWDGEWYRRAYMDDGQPLGSATSPECQIDSLPQSWAVLAGVGDPARALAGLEAVDRRLVDREIGVIKLFDPPFDTSALEPGYVKGYVPGVRENGGQYTHAAIWTVMAHAAAGQTAKAWELFDLVNPIRHGADAAAIATYQVEPYVVAADVYTNPQHAGRGGWTWYTGSSGWMYRLILESLLGIRLAVDRLHVEPRLPAAWPGFTVRYTHRQTLHVIEVRRIGPGERVSRVTSDGVVRDDHTVPLHADRREHQALVEIG